jgi:predicted anti-sigma-YlaC factor YlaD
MSASLDNEPSRLTAAEIADHLAGCSACRQWREAAHSLTRQFRLQGFEQAPGAPEALREAVRTARAWRSPSAQTMVRWSLAAVGLAQLVVTGRLVLWGHFDGLRDLGSLDVALGVGYLVAALRPRRAAGMRSIAGTAAVLLLTSATVDLVSHRTDFYKESPHLLVLAGWLLITLLSSLTPDSGTPSTVRHGAFRIRFATWLGRPAHERHAWTSKLAGKEYGAASAEFSTVQPGPPAATALTDERQWAVGD